MTAWGALADGSVTIDDTAAANRVHNKGFLGTPQPGNTLRLSLVEAAYAVAEGRLAVDGTDLAGLLTAAAEGDRTEVHYLAFQDLRGRGLVVRHTDDPAADHVWARGDGPKQDPWFRSRPVGEAWPVTGTDLLAWIGDVVAVVDEDGIVTHYRIDEVHPVGVMPLGALPKASARLLADRVLVTDPALVAALAEEWIGTPHGDGRILSLTEARALVERGVLDLTLHASATPAIDAAYRQFRSNGAVARSGFRFGTHLRAYSGSPDAGHAEWLVHCADAATPLRWSDLSRGVRLAHGVRKQFLVAVASGDQVRFVELAWFRP